MTIDTETLDDIRGPVLRPGDGGFDAATGIWNGMVERTPRLVVRPAGAADVAASVVHARRNGLSVSVRAGGHNIAGGALADGGLTLDVSHLRGVAVDPAARTATVEPGCLLGHVDAATQRHGLATPLGFVSEVGVAGLTLGGGLGYLTRRFGWTVDNLLAAEVVTADGRLRRASREENADLFWGLRGAGANLGVVTSFTFRLHQVGPRVYGGLIAWPFERAGEVFAAYRALTETAPRELAVWAMVLTAPPAPFLPVEWHNRRLCAMSVCFSGDPGSAADAIAPLRELEAPVADLLHEQPYVELQSYLDDEDPKGQHYYWKTGYLESLEDGLLARVEELGSELPIPGADLGILHVGGALNDRAEDDGAVGNREARYVVGVKARWAPDEPSARDWVRAAWSDIEQFSTGRSYVNFQTDDEDERRVRATYGPNFDRLAALKAEYDPDNVFRSNRNVPPAR